MFRRRILHQTLRLYSTAGPGSKAANILCPLPSRTLLRISGDEVSSFLQGLITNDMQHFTEGAKSIYAMFLNIKGRVLYDTLLHKWQENESFLIECDTGVSGSLQKHLKLYKLKRKLEISSCDKYKVWVLFKSNGNAAPSSHDDTQLHFYKDPRLSDLGFRVLAPSSISVNRIAEAIGGNITVEKDDENYKHLRYKLGVSEGCQELPPGSSFPLEINCDYLHGVSFHKGCYIGQELTARVYHTGVIRKRIMPLKFSEDVKETINVDSKIIDVNKPKSSVGKLKCYLKDAGLGLIRMKEALEAKELKVGNYRVETSKPSWWPIEALKEKLNINKLE